MVNTGRSVNIETRILILDTFMNKLKHSGYNKKMIGNTKSRLDRLLQKGKKRKQKGRVNKQKFKTP